jgi:hypothetical protein
MFDLRIHCLAVQDNIPVRLLEKLEDLLRPLVDAKDGGITSEDFILNERISVAEFPVHMVMKQHVLPAHLFHDGGTKSRYLPALNLEVEAYDKKLNPYA